jgi:predicted transcriptional regulator of viral defense system
MLSKLTLQDQALAIVKKSGILRPRDLDQYGIPREILRRLCQRGLIARVEHGLYSLPGARVTEHNTMAHVCKRIPNGVICLLSALRFHGLTTQSPHLVWVALDPKAHKSKTTNLPVRFVRFSGAALQEGVESYTIEGVNVKIYNPAKTVADCFKYRNKIGLDVAIEALRDCVHAKLCHMDELWRYGKVCRVSNVMRPYLEAMVQ